MTSIINTNQSSELIFATPDEDSIVENIIFPPPEIRLIIDKSALFVARNGPEFESRIREKERQNSKFSFLIPTDPFHAYYRSKILESLSSSNSANSTRISTDNISSISEIPSAIKPVEPIVEKPIPPQPSPFIFSTNMPAITAQDLDIVKLTAQFFARNGTEFISGLFQREGRNFQFDFLRPNHSLHSYFSRLVDQYTQILLPPGDMLQDLKDRANHKPKILEHVRQVLEWRDYEAREKQKRDADHEKERALLASIDWHDAVLVESILFTQDDEFAGFPEPLSLSDLQARTLAEKHSAAESALYAAFGYEGAKADLAKREDQESNDMDMDMDTDQPSAPLKIRKDYVPLAQKVSAAAIATSNEPEILCPRCQKKIPASQMEEHMKIELLDPRWREQRQKEDEKEKAMRAVTIDSETYLKQMARQRADIFGEEEEEILQRIKAEEEARIKKESRIAENLERRRQERQDREAEKVTIAAKSATTFPVAAFIPAPVHPVSLPPTSHTVLPVTEEISPAMTAAAEPEAKRAKVDEADAVKVQQVEEVAPLEGLVSEKAFLASFSELTVLVQVHIPQDGKFGGKLQGQVEEISMSLKDTISSLKDRIFDLVQVPVNKQRLKLSLSNGTNIPLLKDDFSLAYYNIDENAVIAMSLKERGGRK